MRQRPYSVALFCSRLLRFCMKVRSSLMLSHLTHLLDMMASVIATLAMMCHTHQKGDRKLRI